MIKKAIWFHVLMSAFIFLYPYWINDFSAIMVLKNFLTSVIISIFYMIVLFVFGCLFLEKNSE